MFYEELVVHSRSRWRLRTAHSTLRRTCLRFGDAMAEEYAAYEEEEANSRRLHPIFG